MRAFIASPLFAVTATLASYYGAKLLYGRLKLFLLNPVLVSVAVLIALLKAVGLDYASYMKGGQIISFFLGPAVVALGLPLYRQLEQLKRRKVSLLVSIFGGSLVGILAAALPAQLLGCPSALVASLAPKSVTTPIAMGIAELLGGIPPLTAAVVIATGILGAVAGPPFLRALGVRSPIAFGLAMGAAAHGIGTARCLEEGEAQGAAGGLAIGLNGIATALLAPWVVRLLQLLR